MKRSTLVVIVLVIVALGLGGLFALSGRDDNPEPESTTNTQQTDENATSQPQETPAGDTGSGDTESTTDEVEIEDFAFGPASITVKSGTTVTWTNRDSVQHSVVPDDGDSDAFEASELLGQDESYSFTFDTPGTYTYHCGPHPNMTGSVTVTE